MTCCTRPHGKALITARTDVCYNLRRGIEFSSLHGGLNIEGDEVQNPRDNRKRRGGQKNS